MAWVVALMAALLMARSQAQSQASFSYKACDIDLAQRTTLIFVADPGGFSGTAEATFYINNLRNKKQLPKGASSCPGGYMGTIMKQNVAVITTGIGPTAAALCVYDVLTQCGSRVKDVFYSGTSGWSSQLGGVINNGSCSAGANKNGGIARIGDICVSPFSVNWDCRQASWQQTAAGFPNECTYPAQNYGPADSFLYGQCQFTDVTPQQLALSDEVLAASASRSNELPIRNSVIQALEQTYWSNMSAGTNVMYPQLSATVPPAVWSYKQCMEIDSQYFWSGAPWDMVSRQYVAETLNKALKVSSYNQGNVIGVSAMEGIGLSMAMEKYNALKSTRRRVPYTIVRGMSDWVHTPLIYKGAGVWAAGPEVSNFAEGYKYAISTASGVVLSTLQARCGKLGQQGANPSHLPKPPPGDCTFTINYS